MKNYFKVSIIVISVSSALFSCAPENVTEGDFVIEESEEQAINGKGSVRQPL